MSVSSASVSRFRSLRLISVILSDCPFNPDFGIFSRRFKWRASSVYGIERLRHEAAEEEKGKRTPRSQSRTNPRYPKEVAGIYGPLMMRSGLLYPES